MITTFGIRHHGPGSARSLLKALEQLQPDCLLIEGPSDAEKALGYLAEKDMEPPVAMLIYNPKDIRQASYYPFAVFSPEWQAWFYAHRSQTPARFIDLPMEIQFSLDREQEEALRLGLGTVQTPEQTALMEDPLGYIAGIAGYTDRERWWERTFEQRDNGLEIFQSVLELITALREETGRQEKPDTLLREAYMRKMIREALKEGFRNIAVVCGAWHAPVLQNFTRYQQKSDNALLRGIKKTKTECTWIPWSYSRLAISSGYGAGVISPAWYELLFNQRQHVTTVWMAKVGQLFRSEGMEASPADALEAVRLAEALAILRGQSVPGLEELQEAAVAVFGKGDSSQLDLIREKLIIGDKVGKTPAKIPVIPLQKDLDAQIKTSRMTKYWGDPQEQWLKATATNPRGGIDLREGTDLLKSHLLHRLHILGVHWGVPQEFASKYAGGFKEYWQLKWQPDFAIQIIEAGMMGNTVETAAANILRRKAEDVKSLAEMTGMVRAALQADLQSVIDPLIHQLQELAALTHDVYFLMKSLPGLIQIIQYGDARKTNVKAIAKMVDEVIPRICIGLPGACIHIDEEMAQELFKKMISTNHAIHLTADADHMDRWYQTLDQIGESRMAEPLLSGASVRILFDKGHWDRDRTSQQLYFALSHGNTAIEVAQWVEGFLYGSGLLLIHHPPLWQLFDTWISGLKEDDFREILPLLRRTFSNFPPAERQKMMNLAERGVLHTIDTLDQLPVANTQNEQALKATRILLGIA